MASRVSWPFGDRLPILTLPEMMYSRFAGPTLREHGVPAWEVGGLQLAGQRGRRVGCDSLEDSSPAEDFVHGWPPPAVESDDTLVRSAAVRNVDVAPSPRRRGEARRAVSSSVCLGGLGGGWRMSIGDLGVACDHHAFHAKYVIALVVGHLGAVRWGQLSRMCQGSNRIKASTAADHALEALARLRP
jgi:hypothetical protein